MTEVIYPIGSDSSDRVGRRWLNKFFSGLDDMGISTDQMLDIMTSTVEMVAEVDSKGINATDQYVNEFFKERGLIPASQQIPGDELVPVADLFLTGYCASEALWRRLTGAWKGPKVAQNG